MWEGEKVLAVDGGDDCNTGVLSTTELWPEMLMSEDCPPGALSGESECCRASPMDSECIAGAYGPL